MTISGRRCINRLQLLASIPLKFMRFKARLFYPSGIQYSVHTCSPCLIIHTGTPPHSSERRAIGARFPDWRHSGTRRQEKRQQPLFRAVRKELPFPTLKHAPPQTWLSRMKPRICRTFTLISSLCSLVPSRGGRYPRQRIHLKNYSRPTPAYSQPRDIKMARNRNRRAARAQSASLFSPLCAGQSTPKGRWGQW